MKPEKYKALVFATPPPPVGGITSIVTMLQDGLAHREDVGFASPAKKTTRLAINLFRPFRNIVKLVRSVMCVAKGGRILIFSGEASSLFEKMAWSTLILLLGRKPVVLMVSGLFPKFWDKFPLIGRRLISFIVHHKNFQLVVQSETWREYYQGVFPQAYIKIVGATAHKDFFESQRISSTHQLFTQLIFVGWVIPEKGVLDLIDAMRILIETHPNITLRIVGPLFGQEAYWDEVAITKQVFNHVQFQGSIASRRELIQELNTASIFVFPSHFEGFPVALLEAITLGLACVGTSVGGIPDILDHGKAGILVEPNSPEELADALKSLINNRKLLETYSNESSKRARETYNYSQCINSYASVLGLR